MDRYTKVVAVVLVMLVATLGLARAESLDFYQQDFNFDGTAYNDSEWGKLGYTFTGQDPIMYLNLAVNGTWQIQNIPVLSIDGTGVEQTMFYAFDLGVARGTDVSSVNYAYSLTAGVSGAMPVGNTPTPVSAITTALYAGFNDGVMPALSAAKPLVGGQAKEPVKHKAKSKIPNQQSKPKGCCPTGVSNSLKYLKDNNKNLGLTDEQTSIAEMEKATGWTAGWGSDLDTWWESKKNYLNDKKYPITTRKEMDIKKIIQELDAGQDIEIQESWLENGIRTGHTTVLAGITEIGIGYGTYSLDIIDDQDQDDNSKGCEGKRTYILFPSGNISENGFISKFEYAVIECPVPEPSTLIVLGGLLIGLFPALRRRR